MTLFDTRNKEIALRKIKRLASSALPLEPFVLALFQLVHDAIPSASNKGFLFDPIAHPAGGVANSPDVYAAVPPYEEFFIRSDSNEAGVRAPLDGPHIATVYATKTIWRMEEFALPWFHKADAYNNVWRPLDWHHVMIVVFREGNETYGIYPIWRSADQKPFSREDYEFMSRCAPYVANGLRTAQLLAQRTANTEATDFTPTSLWGTGVVLMSTTGEVIAIDKEARSMFAGLAIFDGIGVTEFANRIGVALEYIRRGVMEVFHDSAPASMVPATRLFAHRTGAILKFRGVLMTGAEGREYVTVLVERGETAEFRRSRMMVRWGLSRREAEVLSLIAKSKTGPEIATILTISHDTARKHMSSIFKKLGVENRTAAAAIALESLS
ncbi:MAG: helix-turn-helix transcriptional regulator [Candidatus Binataceae bacterium]